MLNHKKSRKIHGSRRQKLLQITYKRKLIRSNMNRNIVDSGIKEEITNHDDRKMGVVDNIDKSKTIINYSVNQKTHACDI